MDHKIKGFKHFANTHVKEHDEQRMNRIVEEYSKRVLLHLDEEYNKQTKWGDRLADKIAQFGGSWKFITYFASILVVWMVFNLLPFTKQFHFDEPPFILLNLVLSFLAGFQAPFIMMSQNRQAARDKREAIIDFAINYKAEQEVDDTQAQIHEMNHRLERIEKLLLEQRSSGKDFF
ncbi:DUF1003 domain-containing protein [Fodinisporobacter ferrooxydans]|uniref:DUF1003 domain-containing protein n=1 Tax=Fodinisporobacter ferrooxydans TaxID=2901836 RepID=A0ABY4CI00_9BACL|nr:DUF1003 domain-containing protein [Alicyclobacillaceae bacterium MYW30-H2]